MNPGPAASHRYPERRAAIPSWITLLLAASCGLLVANLYYAQPLVGPIASELGLPARAAGLIMTMIQIGYGIGLLLIVPLGDLTENRRLILIVIGLDVLAALALAFSSGPLPFLAAALLVGLCSTAAQIIVPYAVHLAPDAMAGRAAGNVMSGLMLGIMLSRPFASFVTAMSSWHAVFLFSAVAMTALAGVLGMTLPEHRPALQLRYGGLLASMGRLLLTTPVLRRRALYQAFLFAAFSLFWTASPLLLAQVFHLSQEGIALFALAGVAGAVSAPVAGRIADRGWMKLPTGLAISLAAAAFLVSRLGEPGSPAALRALVASAILLDFGVSANLVLGQRAIFSVGAAYRGRLNGLYIAIFFMGAAGGSALGAWTYAEGGWALTSSAGFALPAAAFAFFIAGLL
ncbi:MAG: MFS transporter [Rhodomicrobium sp.]